MNFSGLYKAAYSAYAIGSTFYFVLPSAYCQLSTQIQAPDPAKRYHDKHPVIFYVQGAAYAIVRGAFAIHVNSS
jgi:hypothetical protein